MHGASSRWRLTKRQPEIRRSLYANPVWKIGTALYILNSFFRSSDSEDTRPVAKMAKYSTKSISAFALSGRDTSEFEDLEVIETVDVIEQKSPFRWRSAPWTWGYFLLLLLALVIGAVGVAGISQRDNWINLLIALAGISLGFGAATLLYQRFVDLQSREIQSRYERLRNRTDTLAANLNRIRNRTTKE